MGSYEKKTYTKKMLRLMADNSGGKQDGEDIKRLMHSVLCFVWIIYGIAVVQLHVFKTA